MTGVEITSGLGSVYPTYLASGLATVTGINQWLALQPVPQEIQSDNGSSF